MFNQSSSPQSSQQYYSYLLAIILIMLVLSTGTEKSHAAVHFVNMCKDSSTTTGCSQNNGVRMIYIFGEIDAETASKIEHFAATIPINTQFPPVYLNSPGGHITSAIEIGRILRMKAAYVFEKDIFYPNKEATCSSACVMVAAGAKYRNMTSISLHKGYIQKRIKGHQYQSLDMDNDGLQKIYSYYDEMGINPEIKKIIESTPTNDWTDISIDKENSFESQDLVKLGFLMDNNFFITEALKEKKNRNIDIYGTQALMLLAEKNDIDAARKLGERLIHGIDGERQDTINGLYYLNKAGELGDAHSLHELGVYYNSGYKDIKQDKNKAFDYFLRAAKLGFAGSQNNVGWHYYKGEGTEKNLSEAIYWITRAVEQGEPFGYSSLSTIHFEGNGFIRDDVETYKWSLLASRKLPEGTAKNDQLLQLKILSERMSPENIHLANKLADKWKPLHDGGLTMRDKDDI